MPRMNFYAYRLGLEGASFAQRDAADALDIAIDVIATIERQQTQFVVQGRIGPNAYAYNDYSTHAGYQAASERVVWRAPCTAEEQQTLLELTANLHLPFQAAGGALGMDGTTISLQLARHDVQWQFSWWVKPATAYQPLLAIVAQLDQIGLRSFAATRSRADLVAGPIERAKQWFKQ